jgi:hypothetical protein
MAATNRKRQRKAGVKKIFLLILPTKRRRGGGSRGAKKKCENSIIVTKTNFLIFWLCQVSRRHRHKMKSMMHSKVNHKLRTSPPNQQCTDCQSSIPAPSSAPPSNRASPCAPQRQVFSRRRAPRRHMEDRRRWRMEVWNSLFRWFQRLCALFIVLALAYET